MSKSYGEQFDEAMACKDKAEADAWLESEIERYLLMPDFHGDRSEAERVIRTNLGYMAGYYDQTASQKVFDLFGAPHPIFGGPDYWTRVTPEQAFKLGQTQATKANK